MKKIIEMVFILDRSGSMANTVLDTINGFNAMIAKQQKLKGEVYLTTVLFDDEYEIIHNRVNLKDFIPITENEYYVRGTTALLDATGRTINLLSASNLKNHDKVITIMTDGYENSSREFDYPDIKSLIEQKKKDDWQFIFIGANIDALTEGSKIGVNHSYQSRGIKSDYMHVSALYSSYRETGKIDNDDEE